MIEPPAPSTPNPQASAIRPASFWISLVPIAALVALLYVNVRVFGSADNHVSLILATVVAAVLARVVLRVPWNELEKGMLGAINMALQACLILLVVGMLIAAWVQAGVVPLLIVYGLQAISPAIFLVTTCIVCSIVSLATGSSWTTAGTVGIALMGVGSALGLDPGMVAGAVVSGSYFGDKMSPLSDTTNLAPAMAGSSLMEHVGHMVWTVTPALAISLVLYGFLGGAHEAGADSLARVESVIAALDAQFVLSPWLVIPPALVLLLVATRRPAIPALIAGTFVAAALGLLIQPRESWAGGVASYFGALYGGFAIDLVSSVPTGAEYELAREAATTVQALLDGRGGMKSMLGTIALIFCALSFGGVMERSGMLAGVADKILALVRGTGSLIAAVIVTCFGVNVFASDQYMAIVVPGRMFRTAFLQRRLHPKNLSRALEDSGTVTSALVPWNTCGAQMTVVLGVATVAYAPYAFLNWLCPLISIVYGFTGISITRISDAEAERRLTSP